MTGYIARLGPIWVEGQIAQLTRRPQTSTVFLTLRDPLAEVSVQVTCPRSVFDALPTPVTEGARVVVYAKFQYYVPRGTLSLGGQGDPAGRRRRAARPDRATPPAAGRRGPVRPGAQARRCRSCPQRIGLIVGRDSAAERDVVDNATRRWPGVDFRVEHAAVQGHDAARQVIEALARARPRPRRRRDRDRPRRRRARGPAAVLRRGPDPRRRRLPDAGRQRDRPRGGPAAARPGRRPPRVDPDRRGQAGRARRSARSSQRRRRARDRGRYVVGQLHRPRAARPRLRCARGRCMARPARDLRPPRRRGRRACRASHDAPRPSARPSRATTSSTGWPGCARSRRWPRCSAGMPSCRHAAGARRHRCRARSPPATHVDARLAAGRLRPPPSTRTPHPIHEGTR